MGVGTAASEEAALQEEGAAYERRARRERLGEARDGLQRARLERARGGGRLRMLSSALPDGARPMILPE